MSNTQNNLFWNMNSTQVRNAAEKWRIILFRARIEKASIAIYCIAASEALYWADDNGYKLKSDDKPKPAMPASLAKRTRPFTRHLFELCGKYGVNHWGAGVPIDAIRTHFKRAYSLKNDEPF